MPKIKVMSKQLAELIAAGEVVERPSSVIKELLENSIDANATSVTVEINNGGITFMRVTDNGGGIAREDVRSAFLSHATSKISAEEDLNSIMTLGFRGEALASVACVSKVELLTREKGEDIGTRYVIESGEEITLDDAGCPQGTTIIVRDLFYSTPARMKFLKKDVTEANAVAGVVDRIALSHPEVSFRFIRDGKQALLTSGKGSVLDAAREIFGREFSDGLIPTECELEGIGVDGYVSKPSASRPNRNMQFFFINGRLVRTGTGSAAISEAYKNSIMVGKFPGCVLNISISPLLVDVNVHPAKTEVRFTDEKKVFNAVFYACKNALDGDTSKVQMKVAPKIDYYQKPLEEPEQIKLGDKKADFWQHIPASPQKPLILRSPEITQPNKDEDERIEREFLIRSQPVQTKVTETAAEPAQSSFDDESFRLIGEAFRTYIICELDGKIIFIDKHASHERMIYESLKNSEEISSQVLLSPVTVTLTKEEYSAVLDNLEALSKGGFAVEDFGAGTVVVREYPMVIMPEDICEVITQAAGRFADKKQELMYDKLDWLYHSFACRAAIKAGDFTSKLEMERFAKKLLSMPEIRCCPHGRPVLIEMTKRELEKNFGRV